MTTKLFLREKLSELLPSVFLTEKLSRMESGEFDGKAVWEETDPVHGLSSEEARKRETAGLVNTPVEADTPTDKEIIRSNVFTYFNLIFLMMAVCLILVGAFRDLTFLPLIIFNTGIGIVQELQSKAVLEKMNMLHAPETKVIRDGKKQKIPSADLVQGDLIILSAGSQIPADARVTEGQLQVNEALLTGEADEITKGAGDSLLSGTVVVSGQCRAVLEKVGSSSYISRLTMEAKKMKRGEQSEMIRSLHRLVRIVGVLIIPIGGLLMYQQHTLNGLNMKESVTATVAAVLGMIPEGLYLLASVAMAVSAMRLAMNQVLIHNMKSIETLARVDVLCVDKTGTITDSIMHVRELIPLDSGMKAEPLLTEFIQAQKNDNATMDALKRWSRGLSHSESVSDGELRAVKMLSFSSAYKYSGVSLERRTCNEGADRQDSDVPIVENYVLGAPDFILRDQYEVYAALIEEKAALGCRVLVFARYEGELSGGALTENAVPLALVLLENPVRESAPRTFRYFAKQGVTVKVISGDSPLTAAEAARRAGIAGADRYVDASSLKVHELARAVSEYTVFGRVTPQRKRELIQALKSQGHTVAMTGDGVNDVLALKDADCSIAMASGSDAAAHAAQMVLLDSDFSRMPDVVAEGRRVVNNIERTATLFLVKNIFSMLLAVFSILAGLNYPMEPSQISLIGMFTIGTPAFFLSLEPNHNRIRGTFLKNVLYRALPAGMTDFLLVSGMVVFCSEFGIEDAQLSTCCTILMSIVGLTVLHRIMKPMTGLHKGIWAMMALGLAVTMRCLPRLFAISALDRKSVMIVLLFSLAILPVLRTMGWLMGRLDTAGKILHYAWSKS